MQEGGQATVLIELQVVLLPRTGELQSASRFAVDTKRPTWTTIQTVQGRCSSPIIVKPARRRPAGRAASREAVW